MKKGVIAVLLILALVVIVSPGIVGKLAEKSVDENLNWAVDNSAELVVTSTGFDRGWFSSEGQHRVELGDGSIRAAMTSFGDTDAPVLLIDTHLDHGLIPFSSMGREEGSLTPGLGSAVSTLAIQGHDGETVEIPGAIYSQVGLGGNLRSSYVLESGSAQTDDGEVIWQPGKISIEADPKTGAVEFSGGFGEVSIADSQQTMTLGGLEFNGDQEQTQYGFFVGDFDMTVGELSFVSGGNQAGGMRGMSIKAASTVDDGIVNAEAQFEIDGQHTPGFGMTTVIADISLKGADAAALGLVSKRLEGLSGSQDPTQMMMMAEEELQGLFASGFSFDVKQLDVALPMGTVETKLNIEIPESDRASFAWTSLLLGAVASMEVKMPEELVTLATQMNPQAGMVVGMGYLKKNGDVYEMSAAYKKGLLTINGAPVPIPLGAFQ